MFEDKKLLYEEGYQLIILSKMSEDLRFLWMLVQAIEILNEI